MEHMVHCVTALFWQLKSVNMDDKVIAEAFLGHALGLHTNF